ncbi:MAG TPA: hypothetical protein VGF55_16625 [Gemmataceae bacterium]|jgi:hypothetical protein
MRARRSQIAAVLALAGHLVGVVGLPLPSAPAAAKPPSTAGKTKPASGCCCACGGGCGGKCCCSGDSAPVDTVPPADHTWGWAAGVQMQTCYGVGPTGLPDLPPALPLSGPTLHSPDAPAGDAIRPSPVIAAAIPTRPPTPPPRPA